LTDVAGVTLTPIVTLDDDGLRRLLDHLRADPDAQQRFRAGWLGRADPLDALRWRVEPDALDHPQREVEALQRIVHARPSGRIAVLEQRTANDRLRELTAVTDSDALDEAIRRYLDPDVPPSPARYPWYAHPVPWFVVGVVVTVAALGAWMLVPQQIGGGRAPDYEPFASSLSVFDRPQTPEEKEAAALFGNNWSPGTSVGDFRLVGEIDDQAVYVTQVEAGVGPWQSDGDICLLVPIPPERGTGWGGGCVPPELFDRSGISTQLPYFGDEPVVWVQWGPVGDELHIVRPEVDDGTRSDRGN